MSRPNNILGVCYLRALLRLRSAVAPLPVVREGDYHAASREQAGYPSASAVRKAFLRGDHAAAQAACGYPLPRGPFHRPEALDTALLYRLRTMGPDALRALPDVSEAWRIGSIRRPGRRGAARSSSVITKAKRYPYARLNRLPPTLCSA